MTLRKLEPGEPSTGVHTIQGLDADGNVIARWECDCPWCDIWRAAKPMLDQAIAKMDAAIPLPPQNGM